MVSTDFYMNISKRYSVHWDYAVNNNTSKPKHLLIVPKFKGGSNYISASFYRNLLNVCTTGNFNSVCLNLTNYFKFMGKENVIDPYLP